MKYIKLFESDNKEPKIGDYIYSDFNFSVGIWRDYINNLIGKLVAIDKGSNRYKVLYYINDDELIKKVFKEQDKKEMIRRQGDKKYILMNFTRLEILYFASTKKVLKMMPALNKYNL